MKNHRNKFKRTGYSLTILALLTAFGSLPVFQAPAFADSSGENSLPVPESDEVTLTALRDIGLIIFQIKQQAKNIYMEATRKKVNFSAEPTIEDLKFIRKADIKQTDKYLKTRPEWLTFYVGTMEPIIHLFEVKTNASSSVKGSNFILVPSSTKKRFKPLLNDYDQGIKTLNKNLSTVFDNISEENNNIVIAKAAVNLYEAADKMERAREKAFKLIKNAKDKKALVKIIRKQEK